MRQLRNAVLQAFGTDLDLVRSDLGEVELRPGQVLFEAGDEVDFVYFPHGGAVSKLTAFSDGSEVESAIIGRDGAVGATSALGLTCSLTRDVCHVATRASRIPAERLRQACQESACIQAAIQRYAVWKLTCAVRTGACNARHPVGPRLCRWLLVCSDVLESNQISLSQDTLGKMLGVQRTSINPILQELKAAGAISIARARLVVANRAMLQARACECYEALKHDHELIYERRSEPSRVAAVAPAE